MVCAQGTEFGGFIVAGYHDVQHAGPSDFRIRLGGVQCMLSVMENAADNAEDGFNQLGDRCWSAGVLKNRHSLQKRVPLRDNIFLQ